MYRLKELPASSAISLQVWSRRMWALDGCDLRRTRWCSSRKASYIGSLSSGGRSRKEVRIGRGGGKPLWTPEEGGLAMI